LGAEKVSEDWGVEKSSSKGEKNPEEEEEWWWVTVGECTLLNSSFASKLAAFMGMKEGL